MAVLLLASFLGAPGRAAMRLLQLVDHPELWIEAVLRQVGVGTGSVGSAIDTGVLGSIARPPRHHAVIVTRVDRHVVDTDLYTAARKRLEDWLVD